MLTMCVALFVVAQGEPIPLNGVHQVVNEVIGAKLGVFGFKTGMGSNTIRLFTSMHNPFSIIVPTYFTVRYTTLVATVLLLHVASTNCAD